METMTRTGERMETAGIPVKQVQPGTARMRDLTPAQRRAVLFAQQQVLRRVRRRRPRMNGRRN